MEASSHPAENLTNNKVKLSELMDLENISVPGVAFYRLDPQSFYARLTEFHQKGDMSSLEGSVAACSGGIFRSSRVNHEFAMMRVDTAKKFSAAKKVNNGIDILTLQDLIKTAQVTEDGYLQLDGFEKPLRILFLNIDLETPEAINAYTVNFLIHDKYKKTGKDIHLDIVVINSDEDQITELGGAFEREVLGRGKGNQIVGTTPNLDSGQ